MRVPPLLAALAALMLAQPAHAATVELVVVGFRPAEPPNRYSTPGLPSDLLELRVTAEPGEADDLRLDGLRVTGTSSLRAGERCTSDAPGSVVCTPRGTATRSEIVETARIDLRDGDDRFPCWTRRRRS